MEPSSNADYNRREYWDARYAEEAHYDWFPSVYGACVEAVLAELERVRADRERRGAAAGAGPLRVLHLGTGNSALCADVDGRWRAAHPAGPALLQVAVDYSPVVIARMRETYAAALGERVRWLVADVRDLAAAGIAAGAAPPLAPPFDVVVDKGTMDALQAAGHTDAAAADIAAMLREVSRCLSDAGEAPAESPAPLRLFLQMTWEVPYMRLAHTCDAAAGYAWGTRETHRYLGDSDMYRLFVYSVGGEEQQQQQQQ